MSPRIQAMHVAMQTAPEDGKLYRMARAALRFADEEKNFFRSVKADRAFNTQAEYDNIVDEWYQEIIGGLRT